jgi:hypothetical protein
VPLNARLQPRRLSLAPAAIGLQADVGRLVGYWRPSVGSLVIAEAMAPSRSS